MPRRSAASLAVIPLITSQRRLVPPSGLSDDVRNVFLEIVGAVSPKHFVRSDAPLLIEYAVAIVQARKAGAQLESEGLVIAGRPSPWCVIQEKSHRAMVALAARLRLAPQSRIDARGAGRSAGRGGSRGIDAILGGRQHVENED